MWHVSMRDFLRTGELGPLRLGMSHTHVRELLGKPEDVGGISRKHRTPALWKYGDIEMHFDADDDRLSLIHADDFDVLSGGRALNVDAWIVRRGIALAEVVKQLDLAGIAHNRKSWPFDDDTVRLAVGTNVTLTFTDQSDEYGPPTGLYAITCSAEGSVRPLPA